MSSRIRRSLPRGVGFAHHFSPLRQHRRPFDIRTKLHNYTQLRGYAAHHYQKHLKTSSKTSTSRSSDTSSAAQLPTSRKIPLFGALAVATILGYVTSTLFFHNASPPPSSSHNASPPSNTSTRPHDHSPTTAMTAEAFDKSLDAVEGPLRMLEDREQLIRKAHGHVLEIALGTARNAPYFDWSAIVATETESSSRSRFASPEKTASSSRSASPEKTSSTPIDSQSQRPTTDSPSQRPITSYTALDVSRDMLEYATEKLQQAVPALRQQSPTVSVLHDSLVHPRDPGFGSPTNPDGTDRPDLFFSESSRRAYTQHSPVAAGCLSYCRQRIRLVKADALAFIPPPLPMPSTPPSSSSYSLFHSPTSPAPAPKTYDTILQTFVLCSVEDPVLLLHNLASVVTPNTGSILLLEHGRATPQHARAYPETCTAQTRTQTQTETQTQTQQSPSSGSPTSITTAWSSFTTSLTNFVTPYRLVNFFLDRSAVGHYDRYGCWWNRDIESIIAEAVATFNNHEEGSSARETTGNGKGDKLTPSSGSLARGGRRLEIVSMTRPNFRQMGTVYAVELRVHEDE